jgi:DNA adenine methylase
VKPPFTYFGGKTAIAAQIAALLPPHEHYVEPFAGSLGVLLAKPPSRMETVNDLDGDLMAFWRVLRDRPADLERVCALTPHSRAEHLADCDRGVPDDLERARRVWVLLTQGRGGHLWRGTGWRYYQNPRGSGSSMPDYLDAYVSRIAPAAARLRRVSLECRPALAVIGAYGQYPGCLIYADPPYLKATRTWSNGHGYGHEMLTGAEHHALAAALHAARAAVVLSGYDSPLYGELYGGWHRAEITTFDGNAARGRRRTEVLWSNRPLSATQPLFGIPNWPAPLTRPANPRRTR